MGQVLYSFAAKEIQNFILQTDKLKEMVGGSELVNRLCRDFLASTLEELGLEGRYQEIGRAAGWAKLLFNTAEDAEKIYRCWPLLVSRFAPGLKVVQSLVSVEEGLARALIESARAEDAARSQTYASLPEAGPLVDRCPRTGAPAVAYGDKKQGNKALIDAGIQRKLATNKPRKSLLSSMFGEGNFEEGHWTDDISKVAGSENGYVAVIHADGNSLGEKVRAISEELRDKGLNAGEVFKAFSGAVEEANQRAAQAAFEKVLLPDFEERKANNRAEFYAARPIVFGGDDLTMIVRADLAFDCTEIFLEAFEQASRELLDERAKQYGIEHFAGGLTACAGIALVKKSFPFTYAYELAESLCKYAKDHCGTERRAGQLKPSCLCFHRVSTSICSDYEDIQKQELTSGTHDGLTLRLWQGPYGVGKHAAKLPAFSDLKQLSATLNHFPSGSIRTLLSTLKETPERAASDYQRILQIVSEQKGKALTSGIETNLRSLTGANGASLWSENRQTPLLDAHVLKKQATTSEKGAPNA